MNVYYQNLGFEYSIDSILLFQTDGSTPYWSDSLFYFYPRLERSIIRGLDEKEKKDYFINTLSDAYREAKNESVPGFSENTDLTFFIKTAKRALSECQYTK